MTRVGLGRRWTAMALGLALGLSLGLSLGLARTASAQPIELRDDRGTLHRLPAPPQRIVTLLPSLTEIAWVMGAGPRLVGVDRYSNWPAEIRSLPRLGGLDDAHIEAIAALRPDVVLASTSARTLDRLEALGITVLRLKSDSHADMRRTMDLMGRLLGTPEAGPRAWARLQAELSAAAARVPPRWRGQRAYFEIGGGPYAAGPRSFIGETLERLGLGNIVTPDLGPFPKLNPEFVVRARPALILGLQQDLAGLAQRPGWTSLPAVQARHWCAFSTERYDLLVRPGPRLGEAAGMVVDCLQWLDRATATGAP